MKKSKSKPIQGITDKIKQSKSKLVQLNTDKEGNVVSGSVNDLGKSKFAFHYLGISIKTADAIFRGDKKDYLAPASLGIQKGDRLIFRAECNDKHPINEMVFEATFVTAVPHSTQPDGYSMCAVSFSRLTNAAFLWDPKKGPHVIYVD